MHFPKYWAKGVWRGRDRAGAPVTREAWGWSDVSESDARDRAEERIRRRAESPPSEQEAAGNDGYPYPRGPLREPVLRTIAAGLPQVRAVVTRNGYGCEVLNTDRVVFIDVDLPPARSPGIFAALFGRLKAPDNERMEREAAKIALLEDWQGRHPALSFRVYRTAAGLRYLLTSVLASADDPVVVEAFAFLDVDPHYRRLCAQQQSFRARLTPKPWRCGIDHPPHRFPYPNAWQENRVADWLERYRVAADRHAVCLHLLTVGTAPAAAAADPIVAEHDRVTRAASILPLA